MPWVIAIMVALTVLAAGAGLSLGNLAGEAERIFCSSRSIPKTMVQPWARPSVP